jgi:3-dehydroquinate synthase
MKAEQAPLSIRHRFGSYEVVQESLQDAFARYEKALVITDENVFRHWGYPLDAWRHFVVPAGEGSKSLATYGEVLLWLADMGAQRSDTILAFGGGVVGDLAGFAAASYMRGIRFVQVATTLLAMVDSSVGGKVGIDLPQGKNLVGAFYPPEHVSLCLEALSTLPEREFNNGAAEIWKYGAILDVALLQSLETQPLGLGDARLPEIVMRCVDLKRQVVEQDELERTGLRAVLNFGHTVGHAIERSTGYSQVLHGEAIAMGMVVEAKIGERLGLTPNGAADRLAKGLSSQALPAKLAQVDPATMVEAMRLDKKASRDGLAFALLTGYGSCKLVPNVPEPVVLECLREYL